jgi:hypothetical protein
MDIRHVFFDLKSREVRKCSRIEEEDVQNREG